MLFGVDSQGRRTPIRLTDEGIMIIQQGSGSGGDNPSYATSSTEAITMSRSKWYQGVLNTPDADTTFRIAYEALCDCHSPRLVFGNYYQDDDPARLSNLDTYTLEKVVYEVDFQGQKKFIPVSWGRSGLKVDVPPGATVESDPTSIEFEKGERFWLRVYVKTASPGKFPYGLVGFAENGEGKMAGDQTANTNFSPQTLAMLAPYTILATPADPKFESIALIGDSISLGAGNSNNNNEGHLSGETGYMQLAAMRLGMGYLTLGMNGQSSSSFLSISRYRRMMMAGKCTRAIVNYGTNDMARTDPNAPNLEQLKANLEDIWKAAAMRGLKVYQTTITPRTNPKADWATNGQVPINDRFMEGASSMRSQLNDWIRSVPSPYLAGILDVASVVETGLNSGRWWEAMTVDGIHPSATGHTAIADLVERVLKQ